MREEDKDGKKKRINTRRKIEGAGEERQKEEPKKKIKQKKKRFSRNYCPGTHGRFESIFVVTFETYRALNSDINSHEVPMIGNFANVLAIIAEKFIK